MFSVKFLTRKGNTKLQMSRFDSATRDVFHPRDVPVSHTGRQSAFTAPSLRSLRTTLHLLRTAELHVAASP